MSKMTGRSSRGLIKILFIGNCMGGWSIQVVDRPTPLGPENAPMNRTFLAVALMFLPAVQSFAQSPAKLSGNANLPAPGNAAQSKFDAQPEKKAGEWVRSLDLADPAKAARVTGVIATHLKLIRDWHNEHPFTAVPAGINPATGKPLSTLDRQLIADSAIPKSVHENLMTGLQRDLSAEQIEVILDKYTVGKVAFTMAGYRAIVPNLTTEEEATIRGFLKQAREEAVDYKNMNEISAIFKIYKTNSEQYLNSKGRNWKEMYKKYTDAAQAKKAAASKPKPSDPDK